MSLPRATYRLQFRNGMTFERAAGLASYWRRLGVSHLYASPIFAAVSGSSHGYDVVDFSRLDPVLGGEAGFLGLCEALKREGLGLILDFVPNHMAASPENPWWHEVLEWGRESRFAGHFDIDWSADRLLLPVLGRSYGEALASGEFTITVDPAAGRLRLSYFELSLPLAPATYALVLGRLQGSAAKAVAGARAAKSPEEAKSQQAKLAARLADPRHLEMVQAGLAALSTDRELLHRLHERQVWRLAHWRAARDSLTYRRFFEISGLVGLRVEQPEVFDEVHGLLLRLVAEGHVDGIRIDHVDGLAEPGRYLERLSNALDPRRGTYLVVEKILEADEALPAGWPVAGTTGYEFIAILSRLLTSEATASDLDRAYGDFTGHGGDYDCLVRATKREILTHNLAAELAMLTRSAAEIAAADLSTRDLGPDTLREAIVALVCALPVYRSYVEGGGPSLADRRLIETTAIEARSAETAAAPEAVDFVAGLLSLDRPKEQRQAALHFTRRFQQTSGPVMAKALEDTVFYRFNRLIALNEVGGDPSTFGDRPETVHAQLRKRRRETPNGLSATATHDTKRGEDARARLYSLSEAPAMWATAVRRWSAMNAEFRRRLTDGPAPEPETEWLVYQALLGAWPVRLAYDDTVGLATFSERFLNYLEKALREAKRRTSWTAPVIPYEEAVRDFAARLLVPDNQTFLADFAVTCQPFLRAGAINGLAQTLLKLTAPGVPDVYQGTELWDFSLVDPDNRRPVDFTVLADLSDWVCRQPAGALLEDWRSGAIKMRVLLAGLEARRQAPPLFAKGDYLPLETRGRRHENVFSFVRTIDQKAGIVVVPRLPLALLDGSDRPKIPAERWADTVVDIPDTLRKRRYREALSGRLIEPDTALPLAGLLQEFPLALLLSI